MSFIDEARKARKNGQQLSLHDYLNRPKTESQTTQPGTNTVSKPASTQQPQTPAGVQTYLDWNTDFDAFAEFSETERKAREGTYQSADSFSNYAAGVAIRAGDMLRRTNYILEDFEKNRSTYDKMFGEGTTDDAIAGMNQRIQYLNSVCKDLEESKKYWDQFSSEEEYKAAIAQGNRQEYLSSFDIEAGKKVVEDLQKQRDALAREISNTNVQNQRQRGLAQSNETSGLEQQLADLDKQITSATLDVEQAQALERKSYYDALAQNRDFSQYAQEGAAIRTIDDDLFYGNVNYREMEKSEKDVYHYLLAKKDQAFRQGDRSAVADYERQLREYLFLMEGILNERQGKREAEFIKNLSPVPRFFAQMDSSLDSGVSNYLGGLRQYAHEGAVAPSASQYAFENFTKDMGFGGKAFFGAIQNMGQNAIPMLSSMLPGGGFVQPILTGVSAAGNAYSQGLSMGMTKKQAKTYGTLVGSSEALLEKLLNGFGGKTGVAPEKLLDNVSHIESGFVRAIFTAGINIGSEEIEELAQTFLEPLFSSVVMDTEYDAPTWEEIAYTAAVTFLSTGAYNVGNVAHAAGEGGYIPKPASAKNAPETEAGAVTPFAKGLDEQETPLSSLDGETAPLQEIPENEPSRAISEGDELLRNAAMEMVTSPAEENAQGTDLREAPVLQSTVTGSAVQSTPVSANSPASVTTNRSAEVQAVDKADVSAMAETLGDLGKSKMSEIYLSDRQSAEEYIPAFISTYRAGQQGAEMPASSVLTQDQREMAYFAGQIDAQNEEISVASNSQLGYNEGTYNEIGTEGQNGQEGRVLHLRNSGQRAGGADSAIQVSRMEESTGRNQSRETTSVSADSGAASLTYGEEVSPASFGIAGGSRKKTIRLVTGGETAATRKAKRIARKHGLKLTLFAGGNLEIDQTVEMSDGTTKKVHVSARAFISGDRVFVRADHPRYTADQLMRHEAGHDMIEKGEINPNDVRERIEDTFGKNKFDELSHLYVKAYEGTGLTAEEIWEEVICDSLGDMNIFADTLREELAQELLNVTKSAVETTRKAPTRAPPSASHTDGGKMSREYWRTDLNKTQMEKLLRWVKHDIQTSTNSICDTANWTFREFDGLPVLAIYSTEHEDDPTILYESKGKRAEYERDFLKITLEEISYGRNIDEKSKITNEILSGSWVLETGSNHDGSGSLGRESSVGDAGVLQKQPGRKPSAAFRSVLENLLKNSKSDVKFSRELDSAQSEITAQYEKEVDRILNGKYSGSKTVLIGYTPEIYRRLGMPSLPFVIGSGHVYSAAKTEAEAKADGVYNSRTNYHGLGETALKNILASASNPIMIISAKDISPNKSPLRSTHSIISIIDIGSKEKSLLIPIEITAERKLGMQRMDVNVLSSAYERAVKGLVDEAIARENIGEVGVYYINKEAANLPRAGVQYPTLVQNAASSNGIIHYFGEKINRNILNQTQSQQFKRWFGDWQNDPKKASKVVNDDGTPKVMYHGSPNEFTVFDKKRSKTGNLYGRGFYFSDSDTHAKTYGEPYEVYLNVRNPLTPGGTKVTKDQIRTFLEAVAENEDDYSIENYGTYDVDEILSGITSHDAFAVIQDINATAIGDFAEAIELFNRVNGTDFDGIVTGTETVVFKPEQIKSATDNVGTFDGSNPDIRFSQEIPSLDGLREQNEALREKMDYWKGQTKRTTAENRTVRKGDVEKLARRLVRDYDSTLSAGDIAADIQALGNFIVRGGDGESEMTWADVKDRAVSIARNIAQNAQVLASDGEAEIYREIRSRLHKQRIAFHNQSDIADYNNFRKRNMGKFILAKDGLPMDVLWMELNSAYGESYFPSDITHPADQLMHLAELLDSMKPIYENPFSYHMAEATEYLANDIIDSLLSEDIRQTPPTFADRQAAKLDKQKADDRERLERLRTQKNERIAELRRQGQERTREALRRVRADRDAKITALKEHYRTKEAKSRESRRATDLRKKIQQHVKELSSTLLRPSDKHHVPDALRGPVARLLEAINLESNYELEYGRDARYHRVKPGESLYSEATKRTQAFAELRKAYAEIAGELVIDPNLMGQNGDPGLFDEVAAMGSKPIAEMNITELETIWQTIRAVEASIRSANKMFAAARFHTVSEAAEALRRDNAGKKEKSQYNYIGWLQKLTSVDMLTPEAFLHRLGDGGDVIFRMMRNAQDEHIRIMKAVSDFTHDELGDVNVKALETELHTITLGGEEIKLSTAQLMELYALMRREQAQAHILTGGILPDMVSTKGIKKIARSEPLRSITPEEVGNALSLLTAEQIAITEKLQEYASTTLSDFGNKASMEVYNYKKFTEEHYWPIRSNKQETKSTVEKDTATTSVANRGFTKATKPNANTSVRLGSIFDTFSTHASEMATYAAWLGTSEDINRIRNFTFRDGEGHRMSTVKGIIDRVHGKDGSAYLQKLLSDIANGVKGTHAETEYMGGLVGNYKAAAVGANLRVIIQQPTAILRALDMIGPQYLMAGIRPGGWEKALRYAPIAQWKDWGYFDLNTGRQMKDVLFESDSKLEKVKQASMWMAGKMDSLAWGQLWNAVEAETKAKRKELKPGTQEFYDAVAKRFTEIIDRTQVVDGILQRSQIMRSASGLTKMATSFMGEPTKQYNMLLNSAYDARHATGKEQRTTAKKRLARTAVALTVSGVVNAMAQSIIDAVRDDDKEKDYWEKWLAAFTGFTGEEEGFGEHLAAFWSGNLESIINPAQYIPYVKDVVSILQGYDVSRMDMESIDKTISAAQNMLKALNGDGKYTIAGASANLFAEGARLLGIPVANFKRDVKAIAMTAAIESDNYLMQYRMERAALNMNYPNNRKTFLDILYHAYVSDREAYELIYADMVSSGFEPDKIRSGMEDRMKADQGVSSVSDLDSRYLSPDDKQLYDEKLAPIQKSSVWKRAGEEGQKKLESNLYDLITENGNGKKLQEKIDGGASYGLNEGEYLLYLLALSITDKPSESGKYGTYTVDEVEQAIRMLQNLSEDERDYLWTAAGKNQKTTPDWDN